MFVFLIYIYIFTINGFLLPKIQHSWYLKNRDSKKQTQKAWLSDIAIFFHVQIHCACQWIMTLPPKILWPTALLNTWNIITFPKSSFYHTNHTFLTNINVWMMDFWSINTRIKKNSSAQNTILCRKWLLQKLTFRHSEITIFNHSQYPTQRTFGEPPAPSISFLRICVATQNSWKLRETGADFVKGKDVDVWICVTKIAFFSISLSLSLPLCVWAFTWSSMHLNMFDGLKSFNIMRIWSK